MSILQSLRKQQLITAFAFQQHTFIADARGVLFWPEEATMVVSDLHLEKGSFYHRFAHPLPDYDSAKTLDALATLIALYQPKRVICLGDSFHDKRGANRLSDALVDKLVTWSQTHEWIWILGNHDPEIPTWLGGTTIHNWHCHGIQFCHEPIEDDPIAASQPQVFGHFHPKHRVNVARQNITAKCFLYTQSRLLMPAFGAYTGGLDSRDNAITSLWIGKEPATLLCHQQKIWRIK